MNFTKRLDPKKRRLLGALVLSLGVIGFYIINVTAVGFLGGFGVGLLIAIGFGLIITHNKTK